jgi:predicted DNA-binding transcriptional regulator YafY
VHFSGVSEALRLEPLSIVVHDHQLYVVARGVGRGSAGRALHPYRFARLGSVEVLEETFTYPARAEYDPEALFESSFGIFVDPPLAAVELRLHPRWRVYAQSHRWHDSQEVGSDGDRVTVRLSVRVCPELEAWILGFGEEAEVVRPPALRRRMARRAAAMARAYASRAAK